MKLKKFGFLKHHKKIRIEGTDIHKVVNKCITGGITLKDIEWKDPLEATAGIKGDDHDRLKKAIGHSYRMTVLNEGGAVPFFRSLKKNIISVAGAFLIGALIFYQTLFVAEIKVDGYSNIAETDIRETLAEAGLYEGVRKPDDYADVKAALYENHKEITWVSIFEDGRSIKVNIAEAGDGQEALPEETMPVNIVACRSGIVEKITPLKGNAKVQKGDYVNKGDVLISGKFKYQSTDYSRGDDFFTLYSHAEGMVLAKVPRQLEFYVEKTIREKTPTGKWLPGILLKAGDVKIDTAAAFCRYEASVRRDKVLADGIWPIPFEFGLVKIEEVTLSEEKRAEGDLNKVMEAAVRQYQREEMKEGEEIVSFTIDYYETANLIKAEVFMEVLEDIGEEKPIKVKKEEKTEKDT